MADIYNTFCAYIKEHNIISENDHIIAGVSGGADSMCLLLLLEQLTTEIPFRLTVVHVNHQLRGKDADADEEFVREFCRKRKIQKVAVRAAVKNYADEHGLSLEEAGRIARYQTFYQVARKIAGSDVVPNNFKAAVAHQRDDNAETILMNLVRGTGMSGLSGMQPVSQRFGLTVIRPMLCLGRKEIEDYLKTQKVEYRTDATNQETEFTRNKVRLNIIPQLQEVNSKASEHINEAAASIVQAQQFIEREATRASKLMVDDRLDGLYIDLDRFAPLDPVVKGQLIRDVIEQMAGSLKDVGRVHIENVLQLEEKQTGRRVELPYGIIASRSYSNIIFRKATRDDRVARDMTEYVRSKPADPGHGGQAYLDPAAYIIDPSRLPAEPVRYQLWDSMEIELRLIHVNSVTRQYLVAKNEYTKAFDCAKIKGNLVLRRPEQGDVIGFSGGRKTIRKYFVDAKVPQEERAKTIVLCDDSQVLWIIGHRMSDAFKISEMTNLALQISILPGETNGETPAV